MDIQHFKVNNDVNDFESMAILVESMGAPGNNVNHNKSYGGSESKHTYKAFGFNSPGMPSSAYNANMLPTKPTVVSDEEEPEYETEVEGSIQKKEAIELINGLLEGEESQPIILTLAKLRDAIIQI